MKRIVVGLVLIFAVVNSALAVCATGSMPFQLQNNTIADATQVMANFNQITTGVGASCAASGVNNDITALGALSTAINPTQGGSNVFNGGVTSGSANAQTITVNNNFASVLVPGIHIAGLFSITNTAAMTISVNGTSYPVWRKQQFGVSSTYGGEAIAGHPFEMVYDGTHFIMLGETIIIAEMKTVAYSAGTAPPPGWFTADGSSFVCATYQDLCNVIGTTYGGSSSNPNLPDTRARVMTGLDNYGTSTGAANRLTSAGTGCGTGFTQVGVSCANGNQSHTQIVAELAVHNHGVNDGGHSHGFPNGAAVPTFTAGGSVASGSAGIVAITSTASATTGISIQNQGSSQAMPIVPNNLGQVMIIRY